MFGGLITKIVALASKAAAVVPDLVGYYLYAWGSNASGQIGDSTVVDKSSPVQVGSTKWAVISSSNRSNGTNISTFAIKENRTLWAWGYSGSYGKLGLGNTVSRSSPVQVGTSTDWDKVSAGKDQTFAIKYNKTLWAWGKNSYGQLGLGNTTNRSSPVQVGSGTTWTQVSGNGYNALALKTDGTLWAWGRNNRGQLGLGDTTTRSSPVQVGGATDWAFVHTRNNGGQSSTFAIKTTGTLWSWGANYNGELGQNNATPRSSPVQVGALTNWSSIATNTYTTFAIKTDGTMWSWGRGNYGARGNGGTANASSPTQSFSSTTWSKVYANTYTAIGKRTDNSIFLWGRIRNGLKGDGTAGTNLTISSPVQVFSTSDWSSPSTGYDSTVGIKTTGTMWSWGRNNVGQLGIGSSTSVSSPVQIGSSTDWSSVASFRYHVAAVKTTGTLWSWGRNVYGQLGVGNATVRSSPTQVGTSTTWSKVSVGREHTVAINTSNNIFSWGRDNFYQLGQSNNVVRSSPVQIGSDSNWAQAQCGGYHTMAVKTDGTLWGWGRNAYGEIGNNKSYVIQVSSPVQVGSASWSKVATSKVRYGAIPRRGHTLIVKTDGTLWACGENVYGQLGINNSRGFAISPLQVGSLSTWSNVAVGDFFSLALKTDGTLWGWGRNNYGQIGDSTVVTRSSPVQIGVATDWSSIECGGYVSAAIKTGNTLWTWGSGSLGVLGSGSVSNRSSPVQVGTLSDWSKVSSGANHMIAVKTDGTLWGWGRNAGTGAGALGQGNVTTRSSPVQIGTSTDWSDASCGRYHSMALKNTGTLWAFGRNVYGQLGLGDTTVRSSPVQVGTGTSWGKVSGAYGHTVAFKSSDNTLWSWGSNAVGQLGLRDITSRSSPVQIGSGTDWSSNFVAGTMSTMAIKSANSLWAWGTGKLGRLGFDASGPLNHHVESPVQIGSGTDWSTVYCGNNFTIAKKTTGSIWGWGRNSSGQIGDGTVVSKSSPVQIGSGTDWSKIVCGYTHTLAIKTTGTLWSWGAATYGVLGGSVARSSPVQIGSATNWSSVSTSKFHSMFSNASSEMWGCGRNNYGNVTTLNNNLSSPVQIGAATDWQKISMAGYSAHATKTV